MLYKDTGIVIKQVEYSDYDRILTIITKNHGKISAIAKGARRLTSSKSASTDLFVKSRYSFAEGKSLDIVTETVVEDVYEKSKESYDQISTLFYLAKVLDKLIVEGDVMQSKDIFQLLEKTLDSLNTAFKNSCSTDVFVATFELHLLKILGLLPSFYNCVECGKELRESKSFLFRPSSGGIICDTCSSLTNGNLTVDTIKTLRYLSESSIDKSVLLRCEDSVLKSVNLVNKGMLEYFGELIFSGTKMLNS